VEEHENGEVGKKKSENIYIISPLKHIFSHDKKIFPKTNKNILQYHKTYKYVKTTRKKRTSKNLLYPTLTLILSHLIQKKQKNPTRKKNILHKKQKR
jgi:hypothetical protein